MKERLQDLVSKEIYEKFLKILEKEKIEYFANCLKFGLKPEVIKKALDISDNDYKKIYSSALKLLQQDVDEVIK